MNTNKYNQVYNYVEMYLTQHYKLIENSKLKYDLIEYGYNETEAQCHSLTITIMLWLEASDIKKIP